MAEEPLFLAVERPREGTELEMLSSRLMRWKDGVWLIDLAATRSYWGGMARRRGVPLLELWRPLVLGLLEPRGAAALARHPFQALLLARHLSARKLSGLVVAEEKVGQALWRELSWLTYWQVTEELLPHLTEKKDPRGHPATFRQKLGLMQRSLKRLGLKLPWQLGEVEPLAIRRRFGALFGDLWEWCYGTEHETSAADPRGFPWTSHRFTEDPRVHRALEYGVNDWQGIEPWLKEDFDKLCASPRWHARERVVALTWRLVFDDMSEQTLSIRFRHPHALHKEMGRHPTALKQCLYVYEAMPKDETVIPPPLVAWQLTVTERMLPTTRGLDLFGVFDDRGERDQTLLELENKLRLALTRHAAREDWLPEDSQMTVTGAEDWPEPPPRAEALGSLAALAAARPLFLYETPKPFDPREKGYELKFLERTMAKWWRSDDWQGGRATRDYFRVKRQGEAGRDYWVYRDGRGQWFVHGVFA